MVAGAKRLHVEYGWIGQPWRDSAFTNSNGTQRPSAIIGSGTSITPGEQTTFSIMFIAPLGGGSYTDTFQLNQTTNFGPLVTVQVTVTNAGSTNHFDRSRTISYANNYDAYVVRDGYFWNDGSTDEYLRNELWPVPTNFLGTTARILFPVASASSRCFGAAAFSFRAGCRPPTANRVPPGLSILA